MRQLILAGLVVLLAGCGHGPVVTVCVSDPAKGGFDCIDHDQKAFFLKYEDSENYVAMPPDDLKTLLDYIKVNCPGSQ
jgi:hypothetical protein